MCTDLTLACNLLAKKPVSLQPENKTMIDEKTLLYCAYGSQTQVVGVVQLDIFLGPTTRSGNTTSKSSQLSFDEESLLGGRYFVTCVVIVGGRPWWASIREVGFYG
ncbi:unnamed protein product [Dibothriocephalus latus]|uniref:Uncharacterized protein n=1 Tax=Dibothriocephalus latus TaxID=60516 RepID=A0A3P7LW51_DIBLA|nr:unnamed protein product [Dibothriocephalus latus]